MSYPESDYLVHDVHFNDNVVQINVFNFIHRRKCYIYKTYWK